jgi:hypothetical protein
MMDTEEGMSSKAFSFLCGVLLTATALLYGCGGEATRQPTVVPTPVPTSVATRVVPEPTQPQPVVTTAAPTALPQAEPTALPSALHITWGEWWYEGEYLANTTKYPADLEYHDRSFNVWVTIRNDSHDVVPGDVLPVLYLTDGDGERPVITWYYSADDLRALNPGEEKKAVFRALTYAPGQWIGRAEIVWHGQVWQQDFPKQ